MKSIDSTLLGIKCDFPPNNLDILLGARINSSGTGATGFYNGKIDDVKIYRCALDSTEIDSIFQAEAPPTLLNPCIVAQYDFNGNANDNSGNGNDGVVNGASLTCDRFGNENSAYSFDGVNDYIEMSDNMFPDGTNPYSLTSWIYLNDTEGWLSIFSYGKNNNTNADNGKVNTFLVSNSFNNRELNNENRNLSNISHGDSLTLNRDKWHFVGFSKGVGNNIGDWYLDGEKLDVQENNLGAIRDILLTGTARIGRTVNTNTTYSYYWAGKLDDIKLFKCELDSVTMDSIWRSESHINTYYDTITVNIIDTTFIFDTTFTEVFDTTFVTIQDTTFVQDTTLTEVFDTTFVTIQDTTFTTINDTVFVSVDDTLMIDVALNLPSPNNVNTLSVFPNPAKDKITIDNGDYGNMSGYSISILNTLGQSMFNSVINQQTFEIDISSWDGGTYFLQIINASAVIIETKHIIVY